MASLVLLVSLIFLTVLLSGPLSLFFLYFDFYILSGMFAVIAMISGAFWTLSAPFPISMVGIISTIMGLTAFARM